MNKLTILIAVVVCMAVCNARVLQEKKDLYDLHKGLVENGQYDLYEDISKLKYPSDCQRQKLRTYAENCGLIIENGRNHLKVRDPETGAIITDIPHKVKGNGTCRDIINILNGRCQNRYYDSYAAYDSYNGKEY
ncbi:uncharacterized protein LOC127869241 [Dreissena polymorpha]|uniref:Uncharacterized protein n=1 Tax=Dreissena polymorpha TaxID=45954 RepID=A0A9D4ME16_DREPO|nr:uncharacterized protein LOC127869241 [Dreissena polymorpha]KAH3874536.1 hypothetical protein DPMN_037781 [Dreissena polymorpha]